MLDTQTPRPLPATTTPTQKPISVPPQGTNTLRTGPATKADLTSGTKRKAEDITRQRASTDPSKQAPPKPVAEPAKPPKKGSYAELLARAKTINSTQKAPVGAIVNKPKAPQEKVQKEWQKKFQEERAAKTGDGRKPSKSPGVASGGEKQGSKPPPGKKEMPVPSRSSSGNLERKPTAPVGSSSKTKSSVIDTKSRVPDRGSRDRSPPSRKPSRDDYSSRGRVSAPPKPRPT